eukprot:14609684-Ditylum_brightwellii.AAC.1
MRWVGIPLFRTRTPFTWCRWHPASPTPAQPCQGTHSNRLHLQPPPSGIQIQCFRLLRLNKTCQDSANYPLKGQYHT